MTPAAARRPRVAGSPLVRRCRLPELGMPEPEAEGVVGRRIGGVYGGLRGSFAIDDMVPRVTEWGERRGGGESPSKGESSRGVEKTSSSVKRARRFPLLALGAGSVLEEGLETARRVLGRRGAEEAMEVGDVDTVVAGRVDGDGDE